VSQKYLRRKYKDPITGKDFLVVGAVGLQQGGVGIPQTGTGVPSNGALGSAGIIGVRSTSNEQSIRIYNNQQTYSQWAFDFTLEQLRAGQGLGSAIPDGRGGLPGGPGGGRGAVPTGPRGQELSPIVPGGGRQSGVGNPSGIGPGTPRGTFPGRSTPPPPLPPGMAAPGAR
jgi:hypothetical protein